MKGFILCAGLGTRLRPLTDQIPKPLIDTGGMTILEHIILKFHKLDIKEIAINLHHLPDKIVKFIESKKFKLNFSFYYEKEILDTGGALKNIKDFATDDVIVHNGDILTYFDLKEVIDYHKKNKNDITLCVMEREGTRKLTFDSKMNLRGWINTEKNVYDGEIKDKLRYSFTGVHIISPHIFDFMPSENKFPVFNFYIKNLKNLKIKGYAVKPDYWFDIGTAEKLEKARNFVSDKFKKGEKI